jgi:ABC-type uncharacterized transport system permease subunit
MSVILLQVLSAALYLFLTVTLWRRLRTDASQDTHLAKPAITKRTSAHKRPLLLAALIIHASALWQIMFAGETMQFSFAIALSCMIWLALVVYWLESQFRPLDGLLLLGLPAATVCALLPIFVTEEHVLVNADTIAFRIHFLVAMLSYSLFTLAALHALLMAGLEHSLHRGKLPTFLTSLPPLMTMDRLLFRMLHIAFALLTLTLLSGIFFSEVLFGKALTLNHKTIFAFISWFIFACLLAGRHLRGWRGQIALRWTLSGFAVLLLAYIGTRFVLEVLLHKG